MSRYASTLAERRAVLLALDPAQFRAYMRKYGRYVPSEGPDGDETCMITMHKARVHALDLPEEERQKSRLWLRQNGYSLELT